MSTHARSLAKGVTWRIVATLTILLGVYFFTEDFVITAQVGVFEVVVNTLLYYLHERIWNRIRWGKSRI